MPTTKRDFLMKAHNLSCPQGARADLGGWMVSEKLDGIRCFWDGGVSRGSLKADVPWANTTKDARYKDAQRATGLWSYYGNVIHAPSEWLDQLPPCFLDGELWRGRGEGSRQRLTRIIKPLTPDPDRWAEVTYQVFDAPPLKQVIRDGECTNTNFKKQFNLAECEDWINTSRLKWICGPHTPFEGRYSRLCEEIKDSSVAQPIQQARLPMSDTKARAEIKRRLAHVLGLQGEGVVVRSSDGLWEPKRSHSVYKVKAIRTTEARVVGFTSGRVTAKGSKLLGKLGALICQMDNGNEFHLSGFTEEERRLHPEAEAWAKDNPNKRIPDPLMDSCSVCFQLGDTVTYKYRELTADGYPSEARYMRQRIMGLE